MKNQETTAAINWHYITVSLIFGAAIILMVLYMPDLREIDSNILHSIREILPPFFEYLPGIISEITRNYYLWPLMVSGGILVSHRYYLEAFLLIFFTQLSHPISQIIKDIICRQRPNGCTYPGYSFPSHHMLAATCFLGILIYLVNKHIYGFWRYFLTALFGAFILLFGLSRLWLGVHFLTDVLEGFFLGFILVNLYIILDKFFSQRA